MYKKLIAEINKIDKFDFEIRVMRATDLVDFDFLFDMVWYDLQAGITFT